jgi:hypothetical protein
MRLPRIRHAPSSRALLRTRFFDQPISAASASGVIAPRIVAGRGIECLPLGSSAGQATRASWFAYRETEGPMNSGDRLRSYPFGHGAAIQQSQKSNTLTLDSAKATGITVPAIHNEACATRG